MIISKQRFSCTGVVKSLCPLYMPVIISKVLEALGFYWVKIMASKTFSLKM